MMYQGKLFAVKIIMNKAVYLCLSLLAVSCSGQETTKNNQQQIIQKDTIMETFNIEEFNKKSMAIMPIYDENKSRWVDSLVPAGYYEDTLSDGTIIRQAEDNYTTGKREYSEVVLPPNTVFCLSKVFDSEGNLKMKFTKDDILGTVSFFPSGKEYYYDKNGKLTKEVDNDKFYDGMNIKVTPDVLFSILDKNHIYDLKERPEGVLFVWFNSPKSEKNMFAKIPYKQGDKPFWEVTRTFMDKETGPFEKIYKIDAMTGELTEIKEDGNKGKKPPYSPFLD